jgi:hypothetical protein
MTFHLMQMDLQKVISQKNFGIGAGSGSVSLIRIRESGSLPQAIPLFSFSFWCKRHRTVGKDEESHKINKKSSSSGGGAHLRMINEKAKSLKPPTVFVQPFPKEISG